MPKSAPSAHMTTDALPLIGAALPLVAADAVLYRLPDDPQPVSASPRSTVQKTPDNRQRRPLHRLGPSGRRPWLP